MKLGSESFESDAFIGTDPHVYIPALASGWKQLFFAAGLDYKYSPLSEFIRMSQTVRRNADHLKILKNTLLLRFLLKFKISLATVGFSYISICFASIYRSTDSRRFPHPGGIQLPHIKGCCFDLATFWCCGKLNALHFWDVLQETQSWDAEAQLGNLVYLWSMSLRIKSEDQLVAAVWPNHAASFLRSNYQADAKKQL